MTATPHSGKEEDFQLFLTLLDRDRWTVSEKAATLKFEQSGFEEQ